jgi:hypothetical protein
MFVAYKNFAYRSGYEEALLQYYKLSIPLLECKRDCFSNHSLCTIHLVTILFTFRKPLLMVNIGSWATGTAPELLSPSNLSWWYVGCQGMLLLPADNASFAQAVASRLAFRAYLWVFQGNHGIHDGGALNSCLYYLGTNFYHQLVTLLARPVSASPRIVEIDSSTGDMANQTVMEGKDLLARLDTWVAPSYGAHGRVIAGDEIYRRTLQVLPSPRCPTHLSSLPPRRRLLSCKKSYMPKALTRSFRSTPIL